MTHPRHANRIPGHRAAWIAAGFAVVVGTLLAVPVVFTALFMGGE